MNKWKDMTKHWHFTYQIAAILVIVAALGLSFMYFYQKNLLKEKQAEEAVEKEVKSASEIVEPTVPVVEDAKKERQEDVKVDTSSISEDLMDEIAQASTLTLHFPETLAWPIEGNVILNYSMDQTIYFETLQQYRYNPALVIAGEVNEQVVSACDGKVESILTDAKTGTTITVDIGDGYKAVYGQLKEIPVATGTYVTKGQCIGYVSQPSKYYSKEGPNLYFQILKDGNPMNPQDYLEQ